jgi:hypothetical protein
MEAERLGRWPKPTVASSMQRGTRIEAIPMTTRRNASWLVFLAPLAACVWSSRPGLPGTAQEDAPAVDGAIEAPPLSRDAAVEDAAPPPLPPDVPVAGADAASPLDGSSLDECRFVPSRDGAVAPDGALVVDGGYFANDRGEGCSPVPRTDAGLGDGGIEAGEDRPFSDRADGLEENREDVADVSPDTFSEGGRP